MKMVPQNGLQFSVPTQESSLEAETWQELSDFYARNSRTVSWRARGSRENLEFVQPAIESWLGFSQTHWYLPGFWEGRIDPRDREAFLAFHRGEGLESGLHRYRYRIIGENDEPVWIEEHSCVRVDSSGESLICGLFTDVSKEQQLSEEILRISNFERERLGQDLHDDFCQNLAGIACLSKTLENCLLKESPGNARHATLITEQITEALSRVRTLSHSLAPLQLEDTELVRCLEKLVRDTETRSGVSCHTDFDDSIVVESYETRRNLFRLCQEAVRNAIRHGGATQLTLALTRQADSLCRLSVEDNGRGFPDRPASSEGLGIRLMKHRCRQFGGTLNLSNAPRGGAVVSCTFSNP